MADTRSEVGNEQDKPGTRKQGRRTRTITMVVSKGLKN